MRKRKLTSSSSGEFTCQPAEVARAIGECLTELEASRFPVRLLEHDAGLWRGNEEESRQRLGWLHVADTMPPHLDALISFAGEMKHARIADVVLLGMGGSSLGAEVINQVIGRAPGYPRLHVLDSTVPGAIRAVDRAIDLRHTLFIVSSKSGGTLEPNLLYAYFREEARSAGGNAGAQFIAITDSGSSLERTAREDSFRRAFLNPADIGGRYSVLSLFGLVPAALMGIDIKALLGRAAAMARLCGSATPTRDNPGVSLGAFIGGCARLGRDKLTLLTSFPLRSFGLWAEQLIAESTGKSGRGIVPVTGEPELPLSAYAEDRAFVYLRLRGARNAASDALFRRLKEAGFPCAMIQVADRYALGGEFYRWEYATAVAGALLGVNPFDQPDVQRAKDASTRTLQHFAAHGALPAIDTVPHASTLLASLKPSDYVAVTAYLHQRPETDEVFQHLRRRLAQQYRVSTTIGYGPRFLHSTGQLHKGGPDGCVVIQIVSGHRNDVPVPGRGYSFGTVANAQALGDLQALLSLKRRTGRVVLDDDEPSLLAQALEAL